MNRMIVSGASGFLGSMIIKRAIDLKNINIIAITSRPREASRIFGRNCRVVMLDDFLNGGFQFLHDDIFINCFFPTNADGYRMADGLEKGFKLMTAANDCGVGAFINISSQSVYESRRMQPANENAVLSLETGYAVGKYCSEVFCRQVFKEIPYTNIRLASLLGVGYDQRIINRMVDQALRGMELKIWGGMQRYGFLDVRDAADGLIRMAMSAPSYWKPQYNLGRMENYTLIEIADNIVEQLRSRGVISSYVIEKGTDMRNSSIDSSQFMKDFRWEPEIPLVQTIADIIESKMNAMDEQAL